MTTRKQPVPIPAFLPKKSLMGPPMNQPPTMAPTVYAEAMLTHANDLLLMMTDQY